MHHEPSRSDVVRVESTLRIAQMHVVFPRGNGALEYSPKADLGYALFPFSERASPLALIKNSAPLFEWGRFLDLQAYTLHSRGTVFDFQQSNNAWLRPNQSILHSRKSIFCHPAW